jgi:hypothetical protein
MRHDIDYLMSENVFDAWVADAKAIHRSDNDLPGLLTKVGLLTRSFIWPDYFYGGDVKVGQSLIDFIDKDEYWQQQKAKYGY